MRTKVISIGNSRGIRIPKVLLEESGIDTEVDVKISVGGLTVSPIKRTRKAVAETALLSEAELKTDWERPEEDLAWAALQ